MDFIIKTNNKNQLSKIDTSFFLYFDILISFSNHK